LDRYRHNSPASRHSLRENGDQWNLCLDFDVVDAASEGNRLVSILEYTEFDSVAQSMIDSLETVKRMPVWQARAFELEIELYRAMDAVTAATAQVRQDETIDSLVYLLKATRSFSNVSKRIKELLQAIVDDAQG
jgi:hypothetical protein